MMPVPYDPEVHNIQATSFGNHLRNHFKDKTLFTYKHMKTGNWMVAVWRDDGKGEARERGRWFAELAMLGKTPEGTPGIVDSIASIQRDTTHCQKKIAQNRHVIETIDAAGEQADLETTIQAQDARDFLIKRANHSVRVFPTETKRSTKEAQCRQ